MWRKSENLESSYSKVKFREGVKLHRGGQHVISPCSVLHVSLRGECRTSASGPMAMDGDNDDEPGFRTTLVISFQK